jgi:uncharacterized damage-inducible protein DinB
MTTPNDVIATGLRQTEGLFRRFTADLKPVEWHAQPVPGVNSVAWVVGHLTVIDHKRAAALGAADLPGLPAGFAERYSQTRKPAEAQTGLDSDDELTRLFLAVRASLTAAVLAASAEQLAEPLPTPGPLFATQGEAALFMGLHAAMHLGQITVIRRLLGYPPVS